MLVLIFRIDFFVLFGFIRPGLQMDGTWMDGWPLDCKLAIGWNWKFDLFSKLHVKVLLLCSISLGNPKSQFDLVWIEKIGRIKKYYSMQYYYYS